MILESECREILENLLSRLEANKESSSVASSALIKNYGMTLGDADHLLKDVLKWDDRRAISIHLSDRASVSNNHNGEAAHSETEEADNVVTETSHCLDITGTPLECPFDLNDQTIGDNEANGPKQPDSSLEARNGSKISIREASVFLNIVHEFLLEDGDGNGHSDLKSFPFVIVCDGNDSRGTFFTGYQKTDGRLERFGVTCNGTVMSMDEFPKLEKMISQRSFGFSPRDVVETEAKAVYCILESANDPEMRNQSNIELTCKWSRIERVLEIPNGDATCNIKFDVSLGDIRSAAHDKFQELILLQDLANGLRTGEVTWTSVQTDSSIETNVVELLERMKMSGGETKRKYEKKTRDSVCVAFDVVRQRSMDFTDKVWNVLKGSRSLNELAISIAVVLETVRLGEIKPIIFSSNKTSFGKIVSDIAQRKAAVPRLFGIEPLHVLVEMGIEKLRQDYVYILTSSNVVTKDSLDPFFKPKTTSTDWQMDLISLRKLHCTVELVALCHTFVDPSLTVLGTYARHALDSLISVPTVDKLVSFEFGIERKAMKPVLERVSPSMWQVSTTSQHNSYFAQIVYRLTRGHPIHDTKAERGNMDDCSNSKDVHYFMCVGTLVKDLTF